MSLLDENDFCAPQWPGGQNNIFFLLLCTFFQLGKHLRSLRGGHFWRCSPFVAIQTYAFALLEDTLGRYTEVCCTRSCLCCVKQFDMERCKSEVKPLQTSSMPLKREDTLRYVVALAFAFAGFVISLAGRGASQKWNSWRKKLCRVLYGNMFWNSRRGTF